MAAIENFTLVKYLMIGFNFLFWLLGCAIIGIGIWVRVDDSFTKLIDNADAGNILYVAAYVLIAVGAIIMVIGFLGCCGAIRESQCLLGTFFVFLFVIFVALAAVGIWALVSKDTLKDATTKTITDAVKKYETVPGSKSLMDSIQTTLECCGGSKGVLDYEGKALPDSCKIKGTELPYATNCPSALFDFMKQHMFIIGGVAVGVGIIMLIGMSCSCCLFCAIRKRK